MYSLQPLPQLSRIPGLVLPGSTFSDCLVVLQFLHSFGKVLCLDSNILTMSDLQEGLLSAGSSMGKVQDLLVSMLSAAVCDPGIPAGHKVSVCSDVGLLMLALPLITHKYLQTQQIMCAHKMYLLICHLR